MASIQNESKIVVFGCNGPVGSALIEHAVAQGHSAQAITGVCRSGKAELPAGVKLIAADAGSAGAVQRAAQGAELAFCCIGVDYARFTELWPPIVRALIEGLSTARVPLVFADNLYMYGPQDEPLVETMPDTAYGRKPALRARLARQMLEAQRQGRLSVALVRASDFYGPGVRGSHLGELCFPALLRGKAAQFAGTLDQPHAFTYMPDFARALWAVGCAGDAWGEAWHVPNAPAATLHDILLMLGELLGHPARGTALPFWMLRLLALGMPMLRELVEMRFQWDRPYLVDHAKYAARFGAEFTPLADGLRATLEWYRAGSGQVGPH